MQEKQRSKEMKVESVKTKSIVEPYHFAGGGEYYPITVIAENREEAEKKWEKERVLINK